MELPNPFLPGAVSLLEQIDKKLVVVLRDGKTLIGYLRTIDQFANLVLHETLERIHVDNFYGDIPRGIFLIRGENVVLAGEVDEEKPNPLTKVSIEEILRLQSVKVEQRQRFYQTKQQFLRGSGKLGAASGQGNGDKGRTAGRIFSHIYKRALLTDFVSTKFCGFRGGYQKQQQQQGLRPSSIYYCENKLRGPMNCTEKHQNGGNFEKHRVIFVLGQPGSGKGTQCQRIQKLFNYAHLSAGDLLREERRRKDSKFGELIEQHIREGTIVPVEITCKLIENAMNAHAGYVKGFLVDGFPRNKDNLNGWQREMSDKTDVIFVLVLHAPLEICIKRCLNRGQGRTDDNEESMRKRIVTYNEHTLPIIKYYAAQNLVEQVDSNNSPNEVFNDIYAIFDKYGIVAPSSLV